LSNRQKLLTVRIRPICQAPLSDDFDAELFSISQDVHEHFVAILNDVQRLKTDTMDLSVTKRWHLFLGQLLNEVAGASFLLAAHGARFPLFHMLRSAHEYVARAMYYSENKDKLIAHFMDLWNKAARLFKNVEVVPNVSSTVDENVAKFMDANPEWKRP